MPTETYCRNCERPIIRSGTWHNGNDRYYHVGGDVFCETADDDMAVATPE